MHVIIIGAGVGGLALAQGLAQHGVPFSVFERDRVLDSRLQGYRLKIFGEMKSKLEKLLTPEARTVFEATCAKTFLGETNVNATDGSIVACRQVQLPPGVPPPYTADRGLLREAMMTGITEHVHFGKEFNRYEIIDDTNERGVRVWFHDGSSSTGTLLVGADGSNSRVRNQYLPGVLEGIDTGFCCVYGKSPLTEELQQRVPISYRRWLTVVRDEAPIIQSIVMGAGPVTMVSEPCVFDRKTSDTSLPNDYVHWGIMFSATRFGPPSENFTTKLKQEPAAVARSIASEWHVSVKALIDLQDEALTSGSRIFSSNQKLPEWTSTAEVTLLGDAVHVMSPSGGVGAVSALNDAYELMQVITNDKISIESIRSYENRMREFAEGCIRRTNIAGARMLGAEAVKSVV